MSPTTTTSLTSTHTILPDFYTNGTVSFDRTLKVVTPQSILLSNNATEIAERLASILGEPVNHFPFTKELSVFNE